MKNGERLPKEVVLAKPNHGFLVPSTRRLGGPVKHAQLLDSPEGRRLMLLEHAHVTKISHGIRLAGLEPHGRTVRSQGWWVVPDSDAAMLRDGTTP